MKPVDRDGLFATMISKVHDVNKKAFELGEKYANEAIAKLK